MSRRVEYTGTVLDQLRKLDPATARRIWKRTQALAKEPHPPKSSPLKGKLREYLRIRVGDYRVAYYVEDDCVLVVRIGRRSTFYEDLARL